MNLVEAIKPISFFKSHASEVIRDITNNHKTMIISQNGEARVIIQDIKVYEQTQESLALLKILAISSKNLEKGKVKPASSVFADLRKKSNKNNNEI